MEAKSFSSRIRCMSTEPTIPRQPINPPCSIQQDPHGVKILDNSTRQMPGAYGKHNRLQGFQRSYHGVTHFRGTNLAAARCHDITSTQPLIQHLTDGPFDGVGHGGFAEAVTQHHGYRQNGCQRVGNALSGDIRSAAVAGLVHTLVLLVERRRGQHADGAGEHRGLVGEDIAEHVIGDYHIDLLGCAHQLHRGVVHIHVRQLDIRVVPSHLFHHLTPQLAGGEHVNLVHRAQLAVAQASHIEADDSDATDLALAVGQRIVYLTLTVVQHTTLTKLTEIDATGQLAHDQDVQTNNHLELENKNFDQLRVQQRRTQIDEQPQLGADLQQAALRTQNKIYDVPLEPAHRAEQN